MKSRILLLVTLISNVLFAQNYHDTQGKLDVSSSGQAIYTLPVALPPSINSVGPTINLVYSSGQSGGIAGQGWNISSISAITRIATRLDIDGFIDGVDFDDNDKLALDGQRLLIKTGTYWANGSTYETEVQSNAKIEYIIQGNMTFFLVTTPDGSRTWYGNTGNGTYQNATDLSAWYIVRFEDAEGNFILYNYSKPLNKNLCIDTIQFSANTNGNTIPLNYIKFSYPTTGAVRTERAYFSGVLIEKAELLTNIKVYTNGQLFKEYEITHTTDTQLGYQRVIGIQEKNGAGELANPVVFDYGSTISTNVGSEITKSYKNNISFNKAKLGGDFDGDGRLDFIADNNLYTKVFDGVSGTTPGTVPFTVNERTSFVATTLSGNKLNQFQSVVNADESTDFINFMVYNKNPNIIPYTNGLGFSYMKSIEFDNTINYEDSHTPIYPDNCQSPTIKVSNNYLEGDFNGDGISEVLIQSTLNEKFSFSEIIHTELNGYDQYDCNTIITHDGEEFHILNLDDNASSTIDTPGFVKLQNADALVGGKHFVMDFNSDGKSDVLVLNDDATYKVISFNQLTVSPWVELEIIGQGTLSHYNNNKQILFGDYNGDGKTDIMMPNVDGNGCEGDSSCDAWYIYYSNPKPNGGSFFEEQFQNIVSYLPQRNYKLSTVLNSYYALDVNKDGKTDLVKVERVTYKPSWTINDHNTKWKVTTYINNIGNGGIGGFNSDYISPCISQSSILNGNTITYQVCDHNSDNNWFTIPIASSYKNNELNNELVMVQEQNNTLTYINFSKDFNKDNRIIKVTQSGGAIVDDIEYKAMEPGATNLNFGSGTDFYSSTNNSVYPSIELKQIPSMKLVLKVKNTALGITKIQDFKYNGYVINIGRVGVIGFNKTARSSWYMSSSDKKSWVVSINDPLKRGANLRNYSVLLNGSSEFDFNANYISERLSATDNIFNQTTDPITKRYTILLQKQTTTDYLSNIINEKIYNIYSPDFLLPVNVTSKNYLETQLHSEVTTKTEYDNNTMGIGNNYYIGRPKEVNTTSTVYVNTPIAGVADTKTTNEKIFYTNGNITRTEKTPNGDAVTLVEKMEYFSNNLLKSKEISATGTPEAVALVPRKISYTYDATNRFIKTTTDAEGLVTTNEIYDPVYGVVKSQKNPFNQTSTSLFDNWGKQTKTTDFLGKSITYSYSRSNNIYTTIQNGDDGSSSIVEQDILAREVRKGSKNINGNWVYIKTEYDNWGRKYRTSEPYYGTASPTAWNITEYDMYSRPIKTTAQTGQITNITYSGLSVTSNDGLLIKSITKNANGQTIANTDSPGGTIAYKYDAAGNMVESDYGGIKNTITYDNFGRKIQLVDTSAGTYTYSYNAFGEIITETTPKGITAYTYTPVGKVLTKTVQGLTNADDTNIAITYSYDPITKFLTSMMCANPNDGNSNYSYEYDTIGTNPTYQLKQTTENLYPIGSTTSFATFIKTLSFDLFGRTDTETNTATAHGKSSSKVIKNVYSTVNGALIEKKDNATNTSIWLANNVNARGQITNHTLGNGIIVTNGFDDFGYNSSTKNFLGISNVMSLSNVFEPQKGNLISRYTSLFDVNESFSYDALDRLKGWSDNNLIQNFTFTGTTESFLPTTSNVIVTITATTLLSRLTVTTRSNFEGTKRKVKDNASIGDVIEFSGNLIFKNNLTLNPNGLIPLESNFIKYSIIERNPSTGQTNEFQYGTDIQTNTFSFRHTVSQYSEIYLKIVAGNDFNFQNSIAFSLDNIKVREIKTLTQTYDDRGRITANNLGQYNYTTMAKPYQNTSVTLTPEANSYYSVKQLQNISYNAFKAPIQIEEPGIDKISFGYNSMQQRSIMYYGNTNDDKLTRPFRKYYSADGSMEIKATFAVGNPSPTAVEFITYIGGDAYSAPAVVKSNGTTQAYFYLHRDYQGSILAISNNVGAIVEKRLFDPWGNITKVQNGAGVNLAGLTFFDRGYTGHEHLQSVGLINMNARLYDPKLHRFLQPDALIQDPSNTQNYNRYAYCVNNPLKYTDISGNDFGISALIIAVAVALTTYTMTALLADVPFTVGGLIQSAVIASVSCVVTFGIGEAFRTTANLYIRATYAALAHGAFQGGLSAAQGGKFWAGFASGALSSIACSAIEMGSTGINTDKTSCVTEFGAVMNKPAVILATGAIMGGAGSAIGGGNFWQGAVTGLVVAGFNHLMHQGDEAFAKGKLDREVDAAYGASADSEAPATDATLVKMKNSLPTLKRLYPSTGKMGMFAQPDRDTANDGFSIAKTFAYDTDNYKSSTTTYFRKSFESYRILARTMLHEFGHGVHYFNGDFNNYRRNHTTAQTDSWKERYAFKFAFDNGGVLYKNDPWYLKNK